MATLTTKKLDPCIVCGPSGVGKGTVLDRLKELLPSTFGVAVSHTTRKPRKGDINGVHYHFTTRDEFEAGIQNNEFIEYADVHGNYYGTSVNSLKDVQKQNLICLLEIDYQGAKIIKKQKQINAHYLFITANGGINTLKKRLISRKTESDQQIQKRLKTAEKEFNFLNQNPTFFEYVLSNDNLTESVLKLAKQFKKWYQWINDSNLKDKPVTVNDNDIKTSTDVIEVASNPTVICGPSGVGKGTLLAKVKELLPSTFGVAVSHTTRYIRSGEIDGVSYHFTTRDEFKAGIDNNEFVEYADVHGNYYGTSIKSIRDVSKNNLICLLEIDFQGAQIIKNSNQINAHYLFITATGGLNTLKQRLINRKTESDQQIQKRLVTAEKELNFLNDNPDFYESVIYNDDLQDAAFKLIKQFKEWYPWISTDNIQSTAVPVAVPVDNTSASTADDEKKTTNVSCLLYETCSVDDLFNALQFEISIYDIRSADEYKQNHIINSINLSNIASLDNIKQLDYTRIFIYGNGLNNDTNTAKYKKLYEFGKKLNAIQFCVVNEGFDIFATKYSFLCTTDVNRINNRISYPNVVISDRIFVGGEIHAYNANVIKNLGITHIVNTKGKPTKLDANIAKTLKSFDIHIVDDVNSAVFDYFDKSSLFVENALKQNNTNKVLIHCGGGKSRSTTFTIAYLMKYKKQSLAFAYGIVSGARPKTYPNDGFLNELAKYELKLYGKSTKHYIQNSKLRDKNRWKLVLSSWKIN